MRGTLIGLVRIFISILLATSLSLGAAQTSNAGTIDDVIQLTNSARGEVHYCGGRQFQPVPPLKYSSKLTKAAEAQSIYQARNNKMTHDNPEGSLGERVKRVGYRFSQIKENVASRQQSAGEVVNSWLDSPSHCKNIMSGDVEDIGVSVKSSSSGRTYWTMVLGRER